MLIQANQVTSGIQKSVFHLVCISSIDMCQLVSSVAPIIVSAIGISAILAKNIGISYRQYYKMYIGSENVTFVWENWP